MVNVVAGCIGQCSGGGGELGQCGWVQWLMWCVGNSGQCGVGDSSQYGVW